MSATQSPIVGSYLERLERALGDLSSERRREIMGEIEAHINEELSQMGSDPSDVQIINLLERLGEPEFIASEAGVPSRTKKVAAGALEIAALVLLLIGAVLVPIVGWIAGVVLLWVSPVWTTGQKLIGTFIVPGGLGLPFFLMFMSRISLGGSVSECVAVPERVSKRFRSDVERIGDSAGALCSDSGTPRWIGISAIVLLTVASIATVIYLAKKMRSNVADAEGAAAG